MGLDKTVVELSVLKVDLKKSDVKCLWRCCMRRGL